jgi:hypothetical protein
METEKQKRKKKDLEHDLRSNKCIHSRSGDEKAAYTKKCRQSIRHEHIGLVGWDLVLLAERLQFPTRETMVRNHFLNSKCYEDGDKKLTTNSTHSRKLHKTRAEQTTPDINLKKNTRNKPNDNFC